MIDSRAIDTIVLLLLEQNIIGQISFEDDLILTKEIENTLIEFGRFEHGIYYPFEAGSRHLKLKKIKNTVQFNFVDSKEEDHKVVHFFAFPNLQNTRYILNTNPVIYSKCINFYTPARIKPFFQRLVFKILLGFRFRKKNISIIIPANLKKIEILLNSHLYTGVLDGKRTFIQMIFKNNNEDSLYRKISTSNLVNKIIEKEFLIAENIIDSLDQSKIKLPLYKNFLKGRIFSFEMEPKKYSRPFQYSLDKLKLFDFLSEIQNKREYQNPLSQFKKDISFDPFLEDLIVRYKKIAVLSSFSHGDLSPWNLYISKNQLYIFDFETYSQNKPVCYDFIKLQLFYTNPARIKLFLNRLRQKISDYFEFISFKPAEEEVRTMIIVSLLNYITDNIEQHEKKGGNYSELPEYYYLRDILRTLQTTR